jgi:uncharacterized protein DUF4430
MSRRGLPLLMALLALAGCGLGPGKERKGAVELRVTRDFGQRQVRSVRFGKVREDETVMRLLQSRFHVQTRYGGRFVQSIGGVQGRGAGGRHDWFFFVNGVESHMGAAEYSVNPGDVVQWDYRRWDKAMSVPAIVGSFPQPFQTGVGGKRLPVRVECADARARSCTLVKQRLSDLGIVATGASLGATGTQEVGRVVVAPWRQAKLVAAVESLAGGPQKSGVFARFSGDGRGLLLLDADGHVARRAPARTGLVGAFAPSDRQIVWAVTGPDERSVQFAAAALDARVLRDAYAVAAGPGGLDKLPVRP